MSIRASCFSFMCCRSPPTIEQYINLHRENLRCTIRDLDTVCIQLELEAGVCKVQLNRAATKSHERDCKAAARRLVQLDRQRTRVRTQCDRLRTMDIHLITIQTHDALYRAMQEATSCLLRLNRRSQHGANLEGMSKCFIREMATMAHHDQRLQESLEDVEEAAVEMDSDVETEEIEVDRLVQVAQDGVLLMPSTPSSPPCTAVAAHKL